MAAVVALKQPLGELEDCIQGFSKNQSSQILYILCTTACFVSVTFNVLLTQTTLLALAVAACLEGLLVAFKNWLHFNI